jgi:hypothetical protein
MTKLANSQRFKLDPRLKRFATEEQWKKLVVWDKLGSREKAAKQLGVSTTALTIAKKRVERKAAQKGYAPEQDLTHEVPDGLSLRGTSLLYDGEGNIKEYWNKSKQEGMDPEDAVQLPDPKTIVKLSTLYDAEGNVTQQWVAEKPEAKAQAKAWQDYAKELTEGLPRVELIKPVPKPNGKDLLAVYPVSDHHMGMLSWHEETGESYDLKKSEDLLVRATNYLLEASHHCQDALVTFMGDFMHYDSFEQVTPTNKNKLDSDTRFPKLVRAAIRSMRYVIESAAQVHKTVHVIVEVGNHDISSSIFLMEAMKNIYEDNPRITIDTSPKHFHYFRYGKNLIGTYHGHARTVKMQDLPGIMATDMAKDWGETAYRFWLTGHVHHDQVKDFKGCRVESLRVLPPNDAWAHQMGYRAQRDMKSIILDKSYGEVARHTINPERLRALKG